MINEYLINRDKRLKKEESKNNFIFGIILGLIIFYLSVVKFFSSVDTTYDKIEVLFMMLGLLISAVVTIYPNIINRFYIIVRKVFGKIGKILLGIILLVIYLVLVMPIGFLMTIKDKIFIKEIGTSFCSYNSSNSLNYKSRTRRLINVISMFIDEKYILMLPLIIILIILGIVLFFSQTSVIAPFVYTLF